MTTLNWFEIPTTDLDRATTFYESLLATTLRREVFGGVPHAIFVAKDGADGALIQADRRRPGREGSLVYLAANGKLDACLARVAPSGGKVVLPKTDIGDPGFIAIVEDTEGNLVGLHAER